MSRNTSRGQLANPQRRSHRGEGAFAEATQASADEGTALAALVAKAGDGPQELSTTEQPEPIIDEEFKALVPPLSEEELPLLEANVLEDGCRDALVVWRGANILLDGHNRLELCRKYSIPFTVRTVELPDRDAARAWIMQNQLGRRNLPPKVAAYYRGKLYLGRKHQGKRAGASGQNAQKCTTAKEMAAQYGVDEKTVRRDAKLATSVDAVVEVCGDEARRVLLLRCRNLTRGDLKRLAAMEPAEMRDAFESLRRSGQMPDEGNPPAEQTSAGEAATSLPAQGEGSEEAAEASARDEGRSEDVPGTLASAEPEASEGAEETVSQAEGEGKAAVEGKASSGGSKPRQGDAESASKEPPRKREGRKGDGEHWESALQRLKEAWANADSKARGEFLSNLLSDENFRRDVRKLLEKHGEPLL